MKTILIVSDNYNPVIHDYHSQWFAITTKLAIDRAIAQGYSIAPIKPNNHKGNCVLGNLTPIQSKLSNNRI